MQGEHSAILSTVIKLSIVIKTFVVVFFLCRRFTQVLLYIYLVRMSTREFAENKNTHIHYYIMYKTSQHPCADSENYVNGGLDNFFCSHLIRISQRAVRTSIKKQLDPRG